MKSFSLISVLWVFYDGPYHTDNTQLTRQLRSDNSFAAIKSDLRWEMHEIF